MKSKYEIRMIWELTNFLVLQVKQVNDEKNLSQPKYISDLLKKFNLNDCNFAKTLMTSAIKLVLNTKEAKIDISRLY